MYVLLCCWVAAVGAGLLKSEEILEGVTRVSISNDLEFEEQNFIALMTEARQVRFGLLEVLCSFASKRLILLFNAEKGEVERCSANDPYGTKSRKGS